MSELGEYLRWLAQKLLKIPGGLKSLAIAILEMMALVEFSMGIYGMLFGIIGILSDTYTTFQFLSLTNIQWGLVTLVGFFLLTHGFYRMEQNG